MPKNRPKPQKAEILTRLANQGVAVDPLLNSTEVQACSD